MQEEGKSVEMNRYQIRAKKRKQKKELKRHVAKMATKLMNTFISSLPNCVELPRQLMQVEPLSDEQGLVYFKDAMNELVKTKPK